MHARTHSVTRARQTGQMPAARVPIAHSSHSATLHVQQQRGSNAAHRACTAGAATHCMQSITQVFAGRSKHTTQLSASRMPRCCASVLRVNENFAQINLKSSPKSLHTITYSHTHARTHARIHARTAHKYTQQLRALYRRLLQLADLRAEGLQSKNNARAGVRFGTHQTHSQSRQRHLHMYVPPSAPPLSPQLSPQPSYSRLPAPARAHARARATLPPRPRARGLRRARSGLHHQRPRVIAGHVGEQRMKARRVKQYQTRKHTQACRAAHYL